VTGLLTPSAGFFGGRFGLFGGVGVDIGIPLCEVEDVALLIAQR
jgi:hypothetical protein